MIITLLSDFGYQDNYVAVAKGILLQQLPDAAIIDLSHNVKPFHLLECSYLLKSSFLNFSDATVHLSLFNILPHRPSEILITKVDNQFIVSADNGLLPLSFDGDLGVVYKYHQVATSYKEWMQMAALFLNELQSNNYMMDAYEAHQPADYGTHYGALAKLNEIECQVIHIDYYGNVIVNITHERFDDLRQGRNFQIRVVRELLHQISQDYSDVPVSRALCLFNSAGYLEIAVNQGNAASLLGLRLHQEKMVYYQHIKIEFL